MQKRFASKAHSGSSFDVTSFGYFLRAFCISIRLLKGGHVILLRLRVRVLRVRVRVRV